jgi:hypothetical protein
LCDGSTNTAQGPTHAYTNQFTVVLPAGNVPGQLLCQVDNLGPSAAAPGVAIVNGVQGLLVYYGVKRDFTTNDYNVDTYLTADQMSAVDWSNLSSVRLILTFTNPLYRGTPDQPQTIQFERVVEVMARAGPHT